MNALTRQQGGWFIFLSLLFAWIITLLPVPRLISLWWPEWALLVLIYWCLTLPYRIGPGWAWIAGIATDILTGTLLGEHALSFSLIAFICLAFHQRIQAFPLFQQSLVVVLLTLIHQIIGNWIINLSGHPAQSWLPWLTPFLSLFLWPLIFVLLHNLHFHFRVR